MAKNKPSVGMFEQLGIYGMQKIERAVLAGLVTGEPVLLVGSHGSARTALCRCLAGALGLGFRAYDASKARFEDVVGFLMPKSLDAGWVEYAPTSVSMMGQGFVLVDELSRALPAMQGKWLEVILERTIMGRQMQELEHVFAAMSPAEASGARSLDETFACRFAVVVSVPEFKDMTEADREIVMRGARGAGVHGPVPGGSASSAAGLPAPTPGDTPLSRLVAEARAGIEALDESVRATLGRYVMSLERRLEAKKFTIDGMRAGMIYRTLQAYLVVCEILGGPSPAGSLAAFRDELLAGAACCLPFAAAGIDLPPAVLKEAHEGALLSAAGGKHEENVVFPEDPLDTVRFLMEHYDEVPPAEHRTIFKKIAADSFRARTPEKAAPALVALALLAQRTCEGRLDLPPYDKDCILTIFSRLATIPSYLLSEAFRHVIATARPDPEMPRSTDPSCAALVMAMGHRADRAAGPADTRRLVEEIERFLKKQEGCS